MRIAVDIDGILTLEKEGHDYAQRTPNLENISLINKLYEQGNIIILWTARFRRDRRITKHWLSQHAVSYHKLIMRKLQYDVLIDDKATLSLNYISYLENE